MPISIKYYHLDKLSESVHITFSSEDIPCGIKGDTNLLTACAKLVLTETPFGTMKYEYSKIFSFSNPWVNVIPDRFLDIFTDLRDTLIAKALDFLNQKSDFILIENEEEFLEPHRLSPIDLDVKIVSFSENDDSYIFYFMIKPGFSFGADCHRV